jgi:hypothetical protein
MICGGENMSAYSPNRSWPFQFLSFILILSFLLPTYTPVQASDDVLDLVKQFERTVTPINPGGSRDAALKVFQKYQNYKHLVNVEKSAISSNTAKALDEHLISMCQETWSEVAVDQGPKLTHIVPVGTLGTRNAKDTKYKPGKSDKDFIPNGDGASEAVEDFNNKWEKKWNFKPEATDVNVLDPSKADKWPERVRTAVNSEKYNTPGGLKSLENKLWEDQQIGRAHV